MNVRPRSLLCWITKPLVFSFAPDILAFALSGFVSIPSRQHVSLHDTDLFYNRKTNSNSASNITEEGDLDAERLVDEMFPDGIKQ